jgi:hypothetical protein
VKELFASVNSIINSSSARRLGKNAMLVLSTLTREDQERVGLITVNVNVVRGMITIFRATLRTEPVTALYETLHYCALTVNQIRYTQLSCPFAFSAPCYHHASWLHCGGSRSLPRCPQTRSYRQSTRSSCLNRSIPPKGVAV